MPDNSDTRTPSLEGRNLIEIESWDLPLHVGLASALTPPKYRFQGGLDFTQSIDLRGKLLAPRERSEAPIRVHLKPFGPELQFGEGEMDEVGQFYTRSSEGSGLSATLLLPKDALPLAAICLGSRWKYLHIWTFDEDDERASVSAFSFSSVIHENLAGWIAGD